MTPHPTPRPTGSPTSRRTTLQRTTLAGLSLLWLLSGCATIVSGPTQMIGVASIPSGAHVSVDQTLRGQTPLVTPVSRHGNHTVRIEKPGYQPVETILTRRVNGWVFGNLLVGGLLGAGIDAASGAIFEIHPDRIVATLEAQAQPPVLEQAAPQCTEATVRAQCPLYQYRTGIYRGLCKDGSGVEVGPDYVKVLPPEMGRPPHPWQAASCSVARPS